MRFRSRSVLAVAMAGALLLSACGGSDDDAAGGEGSGGDQTINIVAFSVPEAANEAIAEKFKETPEGQGVTFEGAYGASGDQSRAVADGLDADHIHFSLEAHVTRVVEAGLVAEDWNEGPTGGIESGSVVTFVVPEGNPDDIQGWDDLTKDGVEIITPNPASSGSARWNLVAAYGQVIAGGGTEAEAEAYLGDLIDNIAALPGSGRDATTAFRDGTGNVLLTYENEAILARQSGEALDYVVPDTTLRIENPGAILIDAAPVAQQWLDFVLSPEGQKEFAVTGFRPVIDGVDVGEVEGANDPTNPFPEPGTLMTIDDFGGWPAALDRFFDENDGSVTLLLQESGKAG